MVISFESVYMNCEVLVNANGLDKRPNGYISFIYDLTPYGSPLLLPIFCLPIGTFVPNFFPQLNHHWFKAFHRFRFRFG
ncbi:hypothetical protein [Kriegella aquimaris]|uniref:hypothetical protein n=1 Tax=Kriegella aquimaris TaxID=192904 RepID=UPI0021D2BAD5|nr:hypothetical protein [Kriegella aquimaris]